MTQIETDACREALRGTVIKIGDVPNWLKQRLFEALRCTYGMIAPGRALAEELCKAPLDPMRLPFCLRLSTDVNWIQPVWLDHWGSTVLNDGRRAFVSEPDEDFTSEMAHELDDFCVPVGLTWFVSGDSRRSPGFGIRIVMPEPAACEPVHYCLVEGSRSL